MHPHYNHVTGRFVGLCTVIMAVAIAISIPINQYLMPLITPNHVLAPIFTAISLSSVIYAILWSLKKCDGFLKLYWGHLYLNGYWTYVYTIHGDCSGKKYYGYWHVKQNLFCTKIVVVGLDVSADGQQVTERSASYSVTEIMENGGAYDVIFSRTTTDRNQRDFYSKTRIDPVNNPPLESFTATTTLYGADSTGDVHNDTFTKHGTIKDKRDAVEYIRKIVMSGGTPSQG